MGQWSLMSIVAEPIDQEIDSVLELNITSRQAFRLATTGKHLPQDSVVEWA